MAMDKIRSQKVAFFASNENLEVSAPGCMIFCLHVYIRSGIHHLHCAESTELLLLGKSLTKICHALF